MKTRLKYFVYPFIFILLSIPFTIVGEKMLQSNLSAALMWSPPNRFFLIGMYICLWPVLLLYYVEAKVGYHGFTNRSVDFIINAIGWGLFGFGLSIIINKIKKYLTKQFSGWLIATADFYVRSKK